MTRLASVCMSPRQCRQHNLTVFRISDTSASVLVVKGHRLSVDTLNAQCLWKKGVTVYLFV